MISEDNLYLHYSVTATDLKMFIEPVVLEKSWLSVPGEKIQYYECEWDADRLE